MRRALISLALVVLLALTGALLLGHTLLTETQALYAAANEPKQLWVVAGAAPVDLQRFAPIEYERQVLSFLEAHLPAVNTAR